MTKTSRVISTQQNCQITQFIGSLREKTDALDNWAHSVDRSMSGEGFEAYLDFRRLVIECESFNEIIQRRLSEADRNPDDQGMQDQLDELSVRQLTLATHASLKFLRYIADRNLPFGSKEVFIRELQDLHRMKQSLDMERLKDKVDAQCLEDQEKVEEILNVVIEKAPQLFRFESKKS